MSTSEHSVEWLQSEIRKLDVLVGQLTRQCAKDAAMAAEWKATAEVYAADLAVARTELSKRDARIAELEGGIAEDLATVAKQRDAALARAEAAEKAAGALRAGVPLRDEVAKRPPFGERVVCCSGGQAVIEAELARREAEK